jgi:hypothetical protein
MQNSWQDQLPAAFLRSGYWQDEGRPHILEVHQNSKLPVAMGHEID